MQKKQNKLTSPLGLIRQDHGAFPNPKEVHKWHSLEIKMLTLEVHTQGQPVLSMPLSYHEMPPAEALSQKTDSLVSSKSYQVQGLCHQEQ